MTFLLCLAALCVISMGALIDGFLLRTLLELATVKAVVVRSWVKVTQLTGLARIMPGRLVRVGARLVCICGPGRSGIMMATLGWVCVRLVMFRVTFRRFTF